VQSAPDVRIGQIGRKCFKHFRFMLRHSAALSPTFSSSAIRAGSVVNRWWFRDRHGCRLTSCDAGWATTTHTGGRAMTQHPAIAAALADQRRRNALRGRL
jgi:hypothetical protein